LIRTIWGYSVATVATFFFGSIVFAGTFLRCDERLYFWAGQKWSRTLLWAAGCRVRAHGVELVDWSRPHLIVSNHVSAFDILALAVSTPVPFRFVAKKELERVPLFGPAWRAAGHISIDRSDRATAIATLKEGAERLKEEGGAMIVFPEGTRSADGALQPFKRGTFLMALHAGLPIVPAVVVGSERIMPKGRIRIRPAEMHLHFVSPIDVGGYSEDAPDELIGDVWSRMAAMLTAARGA
jgi:1-acyl-sn-glycerol-3-phosphate acyltransferase